MKKIIILVIGAVAMVTPSLSQASDKSLWYLSDDMKLAKAHRDCESERRYGQYQGPVVKLKPSMYLEDIKLNGKQVRAKYRGRTINLALRTTDECGGERQEQVDGKEVTLKLYELEKGIALLRPGKITNSRKTEVYSWMVFDGRQRVLMVNWSTGTCEDPEGDGVVLVRNPDHIYFLKDFAALDEKDRKQHSLKVLEILGRPLAPDSSEISLSLAAYELDLFPESMLHNLRPKELTDSDLLQSLNSTRLLFEFVETDIETNYQCD